MERIITEMSHHEKLNNIMDEVIVEINARRHNLEPLIKQLEIMTFASFDEVAMQDKLDMLVSNSKLKACASELFFMVDYIYEKYNILLGKYTEHVLNTFLRSNTNELFSVRRNTNMKECFFRISSGDTKFGEDKKYLLQIADFGATKYLVAIKIALSISASRK